MANNDPFVIEAEINIQRFGTIEKVQGLLTKEANELYKSNPNYVFGQTNRKHELYVICRPEDHYGRPQMKGKVCALVQSTAIPNHARIMVKESKRKPETIPEMIQRRSQIGRTLYCREAEVEALKAEDVELAEQMAKLGSSAIPEICQGTPNYATFRSEFFKDGHAALAIINEYGWNLVSVRRIYDVHDWLMVVTIELPSSLAGHTVEEQLESFRSEWEEACTDFQNNYEGVELHRCWQTLNLGFEPKDPYK